MSKTMNIYLPDDLYEELKKTARTESTSMSELIRRSLQQYISKKRAEDVKNEIEIAKEQIQNEIRSAADRVIALLFRVGKLAGATRYEQKYEILQTILRDRTEEAKELSDMAEKWAIEQMKGGYNR